MCTSKQALVLSLLCYNQVMLQAKSSNFLRLCACVGVAKLTPGLDSRDDPIVLSLPFLLLNAAAASSTPTGLKGSNEHQKPFRLDGCCCWPCESNKCSCISSQHFLNASCTILVQCQTLDQDSAIEKTRNCTRDCRCKRWHAVMILTMSTDRSANTP